MKCVKCGEAAYCSGFCKEHFPQYLEGKVRQAIRRFSLLKKGDRVLVAASGGKDSTVLLHVLKKLGYDVSAVMVEPGIKGYTDKNAKALAGICSDEGVPLRVIAMESELGMALPEALKRLPGMQACAVCGVLKRRIINKAARGFDAVATGHTMDDETQAFLMNISRNDPRQARRGGPRSSGRGFVPRVKPLYLLKDGETRAYAKLMGWPLYYGRCPLAVDAYRKNFRDFLDALEKKHPNIKDNVIAFYLAEYWGKEKGGEPRVCAKCGEPASGDECKACRIIGALGAGRAPSRAS